LTLEVPTRDDKPLWDVWLSMLWLPAVTVADELGIFDSLADKPATIPELAARMDLNPRAVAAVLPLLAAQGFLVAHEGRFAVSDTTRNFMVHASPFYWGAVFVVQPRANPMHIRLKEALVRKAPAPMGQSSDKPPVESWESGQLDMERARAIAAFMQSHSLPAATGLARNGNFDGVTRLLDVGGGSGCFSIALAQVHPQLRCTVMDLPAMCDVAREHVAAAGLSDRIDARSVDMFRADWPRGYEAAFFSNIFHDWSPDTCAQLAARAFSALPSGGRIYLHEILLDDGGTAPVTAAAFSVLMLLGTRGQQFTFTQLRALLQDAGFVDVEVSATYGYYSLVRARKR
jgi:hypothetical protein